MIDFTNSDLYSIREEDGKTVVLRKEGNYWFGPFPTTQFYDIEKSKDVIRDKNTKIKSVEFVFTRNLKVDAEKTTCLAFVEVKKSIPNLVFKKNLSQRLNLTTELKNLPKVVAGKLGEFLESLPNELRTQALSVLDNLWIVPKTVDEVCTKFVDSWRLLLSVAYGREKSDDIPSTIIESVQNTKTILAFIWILGIEENEIIETMNQAGTSMEEKRRHAQNMTSEVLEIAKTALEQQLYDRLRIERKICPIHTYVVSVEQARDMRLIVSNPI